VLQNGTYLTGSRQVRQHWPPAPTPDALEHVQREWTTQKPRPILPRRSLLPRLLPRRCQRRRADLLRPGLLYYLLWPRPRLGGMAGVTTTTRESRAITSPSAEPIGRMRALLRLSANGLPSFLLLDGIKAAVQTDEKQVAGPCALAH
jgi:hypothetical protein